jgi:hypothetical protein
VSGNESPSEPRFPPDPDSLRSAIDKAWWDIHHSRDQTWKGLQIVVAMAAGMIAVDWQLAQEQATIASGALVVVSSVFGIAIAYRHRKRVEEPQFQVILAAEKALGVQYLYRGMQEPREMSWWEIPLPTRNSVSLFIIRMQLILAAFACVYVWNRHDVGYPEAVGSKPPATEAATPIVPPERVPSPTPKGATP